MSASMMSHVGEIVDGATFKKLIAKSCWTLVKYLKSNDFSQPQSAHGGFHYKFGLNEISEEEVKLDPTNECSAGGLYFTYIESYKWLNYYWFAVTVPDDAQVLFESSKKFKTDKLILLEEIQPTEDMYLKAVLKNGINIKFINEPTDVVSFAAVQQNGYAISYIKDQTEEICLAAVQRDCYALQFVEMQTEKICLAAVQRHGYTLKYVKQQTEAICLAAVRENSEAIKFVEKKTESISAAAARQHGVELNNKKNDIFYIPGMTCDVLRYST